MTPFHTLLLLLVVAAWGCNFVFVKIGLRELPPFLFCSARFFLISFPAIFFFKRPSIPFKWVALYSSAMFIAHFVLIFSGMKAGVSAGLAALLLQIQVFFSLFLAYLFLNEKSHWWQLIGAFVSFTGIAIVSLNLGASASLPGLLLVLASSLAWGLGSIIVKKMGKTHSASLLVWGGLFAWPPLLLLSLFFEESHTTLLQLHTLSPLSYTALLFVVLFSTAYGFTVWNWLLQIYPLATVAPFTLLVPIFAMMCSVLFLNESLEGWKILAASLVIFGLCLNLLGSRKIAKVPSPQ